MSTLSLAAIASALTLDSDDLCPETERTPVSEVKSAPSMPRRFVVDGITVWARTWVTASEMVRE